MVEIQPWAGRDRDTLHSLREPPELDEHMREILTKVVPRRETVKCLIKSVEMKSLERQHSVAV